MLNRPIKKFTLDDGTKITPNELAAKVRISNAAARGRLEKSTNPKILFRKAGKRIKKRELMKYRCSDGKLRTARDAAKEFGLGLSTMSNRMSRGILNVEDLSRPSGRSKNGEMSKVVSEIVKQRMFFDPDGHWALINKCL